MTIRILPSNCDSWAELVGRESPRDQVRPDEHRRSASYAEHACLAVRSGKCCIDFLAMRLHIIFEPLPIDACSFGCHPAFFGTELALDRKSTRLHSSH